MIQGRKIEVAANDIPEKNRLAIIESIDFSNDLLLLRFDERIDMKNTKYEYAIAKLRSDICDLVSWQTGDAFAFSVTFVPEEKFDQSKPMNLHWWRGGGAVITDLRLL